MKHILILFALSFCSQAKANVVGADHQNFNPTTSGLDFVTVQSGQTLDPGVINFGIFTNYAANTLSFLEKANPDLRQSKSELNDKLWSADFNIGMGLTKNWDIGLSLPVLLNQEIDNDYDVAYFDESGNTEQRFNTKYRLVNKKSRSHAAVFSVNHNSIGNNPYTGRSPGLIYNFEIASSWNAGLWVLGANIGHRWRDRGESLAATFSIDPTPNQYIASIAASRYIEKWDLKWITELYGSEASGSTGTNLSNRDYKNAELLSGVKWDTSKNLSIHTGAATEIVSGFGSPDYRIYAGLNYVIGPIFKSSATLAEPVDETPEIVVRSFTLTNLKFKFDSDQLEEESLGQVAEIVTILKDIGKYERVKVDGHTDSMGNDDYNLSLSQRRAEAIASQLATSLRADRKLFIATGLGEGKPIADNGNYQGRAQNRRVVITVFTKNKKFNLSK